jgi:hypothetical protein
MSEGFYLNASPFETRLGRSNFLVLQVTCAHFGYCSELIFSRPSNNTYPGFVASDPFSVFIESKSNIGRMKFPVTDLLPRAMRATEYRMRIPTPKESTIRGKGKKVLSDTTWATCCDRPRPN